MSGFLITPAADGDLDELWSFVAAESGRVAAYRLEGELHESMRRAAASPGMGRLVEAMADKAVRFIVVHRFLVFYRSEVRPIQCVRVLHGSRDLEAALGGREPRG